MPEIEIDYAPRKAFHAFHNRTQRFALLVAHRRAGKTVAAINDAIKEALICEHHEPRISYIGPFRNQAKDIAWAYLKRYTQEIRGHDINESELRVTFGGRSIRIFGADNADALRGVYHDYAVLDEYAFQKPNVYEEIVRPALADRKGRATFISTPYGHNHFYDLYQRVKDDPEWFTLLLKASQSGLIDDGELESLRKEMTPERYAQEFECDFEAPIIGAYYAKILNDMYENGQIDAMPHSSTARVITCWDRGYSDKTSIWWMQFLPTGIHFIDFYENSQQPVDHYVAKLHEKAKEHRFVYETTASGKIKAIGPHDMFSHDPGSGKTYAEFADKLGVSFIRAPDVSVQDGIEAVRTVLPRCRFHRRCQEGVELLKMYRSNDSKLEKYGILGDPLHDFTSHAADALRYGVLCYKEQKGILVKPIDTRVPTLNEMWDIHEKHTKRETRYY